MPAPGARFRAGNRTPGIHGRGRGSRPTDLVHRCQHRCAAVLQQEDDKLRRFRLASVAANGMHVVRPLPPWTPIMIEPSIT